MTQPFLHLERSAKEHPNRIAVSSIGAELTFAELLDSSVRFAKVLRERGVTKGDTVGTLLPSILDVVVSEALFHEACIGAQVPVGHIDVINKVFEWVVVASPIEGFPLERQVVVDDAFMSELAHVIAVPNPIPYNDDSALCRLSFSSGTTGEPKPIPVSIDCMEDRSIERTRQWMPEQPYLCLLGLSTGLTFMSFYFHVYAGETFILAGTGTEVLDQISRHRVKCLMGSPHQLGVMLNHALATDKTFESLTTVMSAGSVLPDAIVNGLHDRFGARVLATYASTEAGSVAIRDGVGALNSLAGTLLDDVDVIITDDKRNSLPEGEVGLVAIKRARQPQEYLNDPEATAHNFHDGYFYPGDLGYLRGRDLYIVGRVSEVFNAAGVKVDPARVEGVAREFSGITDAAVFGFTPPSGLQEICMFYMCDSALDTAGLAALMRTRLGESAPSKYVRVAEIARNHMGKVNRTKLAEQFADIISAPDRSTP
ncbi:MAG: class I adenylate-forming enzyme family protein [Microbacteriaceae bacterium]